MGCQESLEFYLNLSRKELQGLCKTHNLPANRSHTQLAKSLASFSKKKHANITSFKDNLSSPLEASFKKSSLPEPKSKETVYPPEEAIRGAFESSIKEMVVADRPHWKIRSHVGNNNPMASQTIKRAYNTFEGVVCPFPDNIGATEGFCCSTSEPGVGGIRPLVADDVEENTRNKSVSIQCHGAITRNETLKPSMPKISSQKELNNAVDVCSIDSKLLPSHEISTKVVPSFQFFVSSEKGINLYVDLNANPSDWINRLKNDTIISPKAKHQDSRAVSNHIGGSKDVDESTKISSFGIRVGRQSDGVERNTECTNSSLSSVVTEGCHSEAYEPEISGCFEGNQMISSSSITCSSVQDQVGCDVVSCHGNCKTLPQDLVDPSFGMEASIGSVLDASLKPIDEMYLDPMDYHCLKIVPVDSINVKASNQSFAVPDGNQNKMETSDIGNFEKDSSACQATLEKGLTKRLLGTSGQLNRSSNSSYLDGQLSSDCPTTDVHSDTRPANHLNEQIQLAYGGPGNSVTDDSVAVFNDELGGGGIAVKEKESSECLQFQNSLGKGSKRPPKSLEFPEEFPSKRQHANSENNRGKMMNLRSAKSLAKETNPRRSIRLIKYRHRNQHVVADITAAVYSFNSAVFGPPCAFAHGLLQIP